MLAYTGFLKVKNDTVKVSEKFSKRDFVLTDNATSYPQTIQFQLTQDRCSLIDNDKIGDEVTVHFLLKGRAWTNLQGETKYFNSLDVFRVEGKSSGGQDIPANETFVPTPDDSLPF